MIYSPGESAHDLEHERLQNLNRAVTTLPSAASSVGSTAIYNNTAYIADNTTFLGIGAAWYRVGVGDSDNFTRTNSASDIGNTLGNSGWWQAWAAAQGTWGINTNQAYVAAAETNNDIVMVPLGTNNPTIQCQVNGTLNSGVNIRSPGITFRGLDKDNFLFVDLLNSTVRIVKRDAGVNTVLINSATTTTTDGVTYTLAIVCKGRFISVWVDGVAKYTNYDLTLANSKFLNYTWAGLHLGLAGAPATAARWGNFVARQAA